MRESLSGFIKGIKAAFNGYKSSIITSFLLISTFFLIILSANVQYSLQMINGGFQSALTAIETRFLGLYITGGIYSLAITALYSLLIAVSIHNLSLQFKAGGVKLKGLTGIGPGFLAAGCAGCGLGLLSLVGLSGILAFLPYNGELVKIGGIIILTYYIAEVGNPKTCSIRE